MKAVKFRKSDKQLKPFVDEVRSSLINAKPYKTPGLGTFPACSCKDDEDKTMCTIAMFRASSELRDFVAGGALPRLTGSHTEVVQQIIESLRTEGGVAIPMLGHLKADSDKGKSPQLVLQGDNELNTALTVNK